MIESCNSVVNFLTKGKLIQYSHVLDGHAVLGEFVSISINLITLQVFYAV